MSSAGNNVRFNGGGGGSGTSAEVVDRSNLPSPYIENCISDKSVADVVEAMIGCFFVQSGPQAASKIMQWFGLPVVPMHPSFDCYKGYLWVVDLKYAFFSIDLRNFLDFAMKIVWNNVSNFGWKFRIEVFFLSSCRFHFIILRTFSKRFQQTHLVGLAGRWTWNFWLVLNNHQPSCFQYLRFSVGALWMFFFQFSRSNHLVQSAESWCWIPKSSKRPSFFFKIERILNFIFEPVFNPCVGSFSELCNFRKFWHFTHLRFLKCLIRKSIGAQKAPFGFLRHDVTFRNILFHQSVFLDSVSFHPTFISPHIISPHIISPHIISPHIISPHIHFTPRSFHPPFISPHT